MLVLLFLPSMILCARPVTKKPPNNPGGIISGIPPIIPPPVVPNSNQPPVTLFNFDQFSTPTTQNNQVRFTFVFNFGSCLAAE